VQTAITWTPQLREVLLPRLGCVRARAPFPVHCRGKGLPAVLGSTARSGPGHAPSEPPRHRAPLPLRPHRRHRTILGGAWQAETGQGLGDRALSVLDSKNRIAQAAEEGPHRRRPDPEACAS